MSTFKDLCIKNGEYLKINSNILYELPSELKELFYTYNKLGFLTYTSQPGSIKKNKIYKSLYDRRNNGEVLYENGVRKQRAYVRGYMHYSMAKYIIDELKEDKFLIVRAERIKNFVPEIEIKLGSVNFYEDKPIINVPEESKDLKEVKDGEESFYFDIPLHRGFDMLKKSICNSLKIDYFNDIGDGHIVEFDILEVRWDYNDYLFTKLLSLIVNYNKLSG